MAKTELLQVRIDADVKKEASEILEQLGTTVSASVNMYLKQIIIHKGIPFKVVIPDNIDLDKDNELNNQQADFIEETNFEEEPLIENNPQEDQFVQPTFYQSPVNIPNILTEEERNKMLGKTPEDTIKETKMKNKYNDMFHD